MDSEIHEVAGEDRLSELPDSLIIAILSLLPMPDVVATMLLSKRWKHVWTTVPCLEFAPHHRIKFRNDFHKYQAFFSGALGRWNGYKIHKLDISFHVNDIASDALVDSWLRFAIDKQVEELCVYNRGDEYCPPQRLNFGSSITKLWLLQCSLRIDEAVPLQWDRLKSLGIQGSNSYSLSGDAIDKILSGAPLLEELILIFEEISEDLNIRSTSLKKLEIGTNVFKAGLRIWTPNLSCLEISGFLCGGCFLDVPSLTNSILLFDGEINGSTIFLRVNLFDGEINSVEAFNQVFQSIRHVEKITLSELSIQILLLMKKKDTVVKFPNATILNLFPGEVGDVEILGILDMFPNLTKLYLQLARERSFSLAKDCNVDVFTSYSFKATLRSSSLRLRRPLRLTFAL